MSLPEWPGAEVVYSRCQKILEEIRDKFIEDNRDEVKKRWQDWQTFIKHHDWPPEDMQGLIRAMNKGDEEFLKAAIIQYRDTGYLPPYTD